MTKFYLLFDFFSSFANFIFFSPSESLDDEDSSSISSLQSDKKLVDQNNVDKNKIDKTSVVDSTIFDKNSVDKKVTVTKVDSGSSVHTSFKGSGRNYFYVSFLLKKIITFRKKLKIKS